MAQAASLATWLYTRGGESVRLDASIHSGGVRLWVSGPGKLRALHEFTDASALIAYQGQYEKNLLSLGYSLEEFTSDRRKRPR